MLNLNKIFISGNLTRDPELKYTQGGTAICNLTIANNERYKTKAGEQREDVTFIDVEVFGVMAENCGKYLSKGSPVLVVARLKQDSWQDKQTGQKRSKHKLKAESVQFLSTPAAEQEQAEDARSGHFRDDAGDAADINDGEEIPF